MTNRSTQLEEISIDTDSIISSQKNATDSSECSKKERKPFIHYVVKNQQL